METPHSQYFKHHQPNPALTIGNNKFKKYQPVEPIPGVGGTDYKFNDEEVDYIQKGIELGLTNTEDVIIELKIRQVLKNNPEFIPLVIKLIQEKLESKD